MSRVFISDSELTVYRLGFEAGATMVRDELLCKYPQLKFMENDIYELTSTIINTLEGDYTK